MSLPIQLEHLRREVARYGDAPYLLTVADDGRPHSVAVTLAWKGEVASVVCGKRTRANAAARPLVSLLWTPTEAGGYSLIVDGAATVEDETIAVHPTKAVLHRPGKGPAPAAASCSDDCVPLVRRD